jgi:hypothetical protein
VPADCALPPGVDGLPQRHEREQRLDLLRRRCWDLAKICAERGPPLRFALSPERDFYIKHHRNYAGCAYLWLNSEDDLPATVDALRRLEGVEAILPSHVAAKRFHLIRERIGDLVVFGDRDTAFGEIDTIGRYSRGCRRRRDSERCGWRASGGTRFATGRTEWQEVERAARRAFLAVCKG